MVKPDHSPRPVAHVAIIGGGFSGTLQAINLLRHDGPRATLIERRAHVGRGVAYSAAHPSHLLNVRAANMSALPDDPEHFLRWLAEKRPDQPRDFVPRVTYGDYLRELLAEAQARSGDRLAIVRDDTIDIGFDAGGVDVSLASGPVVRADTAILAVGNLPPLEPPGLAEARIGGDRYAPDPWAGDVAEGLCDQDAVLLIGSGLTMIDVALLLEARGFGGKIGAVSRRGLSPRAHADASPAAPGLAERPRLHGSALVRFVRRRAAERGWRHAVDELRPFTQALWRSASIGERARMLRHLRPWWDVHRHRLAPAVAGRIEAMRARGQLSIVAGKDLAFEDREGHVLVSWRERGSAETRSIEARRIVNCTGPQGDLLRATDPLLSRLHARGTIRPDGNRLGIDVTPQAEAIGADGRANPRLLALGPMTRGSFWEIVAVPDIRMQTWSVARRLSNAHWVEGEGL